jgi:hypothetical protein
MLETIVGLAATVILGLITAMWVGMAGRVEEVRREHGREIAACQKIAQTHEVQLAAGNERFGNIQKLLAEIREDVKEIRKNCPKC